MNETLAAIDRIINRIVDNWDEWDGEAQHVAQIEQSEEAWRSTMLGKIRDAIERNLGRICGDDE